MGNVEIELPPGFRFHPTDEELITHYLTPKVANNNFFAIAIGEADFNKHELWDLAGRARMGENEWYFFCVRDKKYPTGSRTNRATQAGYWKATGKDKEIFKGKTQLVIGMKKTLVFYKGRAPKCEKSNWVMHEYRLEGKYSVAITKTLKSEWVLYRVFSKRTNITGVMNSKSYQENLNPSELSPLTDFSHLTLFSYSSTPSTPSSKPLPKTSVPSYLHSSHNAPCNIDRFVNNPESALMPNHFIIKMLIENHGLINSKENNTKGEFSEDRDDDPSTNCIDGQVQQQPLDCVWNY